MTNFYQFKVVTTSKIYIFKEMFFEPNLEYILLVFYNKIL
jgi:hypothetical protein